MSAQLEVTDSFDGDKGFSDRLIPKIQDALGKAFFNIAPQVEDLERNTDLVVFHSGDFRVSARIRRHSYFKRWPDEFTVRTARKSGAKTEIDKIMYGWGDYFFYGFANETNTDICSYGIGNLSIFRKSFWDFFRKHKRFPGEEAYVEKSQCYFRSFKWSMFPEEILIDSKNLNVSFDPSKQLINQ